MSQGIYASMSQMDEVIEEERIRRSDTGLRILLSLLFGLIGGVVEALLWLIVVFQLIVALVTQRRPKPQLREFANRILSYYYRIGRYLTYNESRVPFPFSDFPSALEEDAWDPDETESKALGISRRESEPDFEDEEEALD